MKGYSYTTIISGQDEPTRIGVAFHLDATAWIKAIGAGKDRCHLRVEHGDVAVSVCPADADHVTATDVRMARQLAEAAATYLAECERLHATHTARDEQNSANAA